MTQQKNKKVLLIGWDAADWKIINPLLDAGKMPNLEHLVNAGVMGNLATLYPSLSPMLWTSIATGKRPFKHGVLGFTEPDPHQAGIRPVSNFSRKTRAVWNILNINGLRSNVVGWWPSHPAEPINGVMVSNHYQRAVAPLGKPWPLRPGSVHPLRLAKNLADLRLHPQELTPEQIGAFVPEFSRIDQDKDHRLETLAKIIADGSTIHAAATALIQLETWDFMAVYYDAIDHFCHGFMRYHPPRMEGVSQDDFEIFKGVVEAGYRFHDMMLGALLALAGEETTVILISDHGFHPDHLRPKHIPLEPAGPAVQHRRHGILVAKGPKIKQDELVYGASLLDITPTILSLYGLPIGEDMDGTPLVNIFATPEDIHTIPTWDSVSGEDGAHPADTTVDPVQAGEAIKQLVALGYIEPPDNDVEKTVVQTVREMDYNLARSYMDAGRHGEAIPTLEKLVKVWPEESRFGIQLVRSYQAIGRITEARRVLNEIFERKDEIAADAKKDLKKWQRRYKDVKPEDLDSKVVYELRRLQSKAGRNPSAMEYLWGVQLLEEKDASAALDHFKRAEKHNPASSAVHIKKGEAFLGLNQWHEAEPSFRQALKIEPENVAAHIGLCLAFIHQRRNREAMQQALEAVGLNYFNPQAHNLLGVALHRMGRPLDAVKALKVTVAQNPNHVQALRRLAYIYDKRVKDPETAADYRRQAKSAGGRIRDLKAGRIKPQETWPLKRTAVTSDMDALEPGRDRLKSALDNTIIIVSGLPRSGTSMMMQMLAAGGILPLMDGKRPADSHNRKGYYEDSRVKSLRKDASWLSESKGKAIKIVAQLLSQLPLVNKNNYGVILMERDIKEVIASQRDMLDDKRKRGARMPDILLQNTFIAQLRQTKKILALRKIPTLSVRYQDCIANPSAEAARINAFLNNRLNEAAMTAAVDRHLYRHCNRKKMDIT